MPQRRVALGKLLHAENNGVAGRAVNHKNKQSTSERSQEHADQNEESASYETNLTHEPGAMIGQPSLAYCSSLQAKATSTFDQPVQDDA